MDGSIVVSTLVKIVGEKFGSAILNEFGLAWGVKRDLEALGSTVSTIKDVLEDAEQCCINNKQVYNWLRKLKEVVYDADDLLDKIHLEAEKERQEASRGHRRGVIGNFVSESNLAKRLKLGHKIRSINRRLDAVAAERAKFHLQGTHVELREIDIKTLVTWSKIDQDTICGRDSETQMILNQLMHIDGNANVNIISIVGLGGVGKTTLAQLAYNNENELKGHFDKKMWVHVSQNFDIGKIVRAMIESVTQDKCKLENLDPLGEKLTRQLTGKRFLLVLDDIWNENQEEWEKLRSVLNVGAMGSKVIATTRSMRASEIIKASFTFNLTGLSEEMSWALFKQRAFNGSDERDLDCRILDIAKQIMKNCGGVPLALTALGSIMQFKNGIDQWLAVKDSAIWNSGNEGIQVMASLRLSYMHLPPGLKQCFLYCSIFPKGQTIIKLELIGQWIAQGFISVPDSMGTIEDQGNEYFNHLLHISFLQNVQENIEGQVTCKMHDLVHDLAQAIIAREFSIVKGEEVMKNTDSSCRYLHLIEYSKKLEANIAKKVRGLHILKDDFLLVNDIDKAKSLRSLVIVSVQCDRLPIRFSKLIYLRYISISNGTFTMFPESICNLWSLQALHLKGCDKFTDLPETFGRLVGLRTLQLNCAGVRSLPESIGQCSNLQNLIVNCPALEYIPNSLGQIEKLKLFNFSQCFFLKKLQVNVFERTYSIRKIYLVGCDSLEEIPESIGDLTNLECLNLSSCGSLQVLPDTIGNLINLCTVDLFMSSIKVIPSSICNLVNLETLNVGSCYKLKELPGSLGKMKKLKYLNTDRCPLAGMPIGIGKLTNLRKLREFVVGEESKYAHISELQHLNFLSGSLEISRLHNVNSPIEAAEANLKQKQNLEHLKLQWSHRTPERDCDVAVLEGLQPPSSIKSLELYHYPGSRYPNWMTFQNTNLSFQYLTFLTLYSLKNCSALPTLVALSCLRDLRLVGLDSLISISGDFPSLARFYLLEMANLVSISGYFPSLDELVLSSMPNLEELTTVIFATWEEIGNNNAYSNWK